MGDPEKHLFEFGEFHLDTAERLLLRNGSPVPLPPKVFDTLVLLVRNNGRLLDKEQFMNALWPETFVEDVNLAVNISALRKVLGESANGTKYIDTIPKRGYRFAAKVRELDPDAGDLIVHSRLRAKIVAEEIETAIPQTVSTDSKPENSLTVGLTLAADRKRTVSRALGLFFLVGTAVLGSVYFWRAHSKAVTASPSPKINSIAVLPFRAIDAQGDSQYLELGIPDDLINRLSNLKQLVIRPTSSVRTHSLDREDPVSAGRALKVEAILEGDLQRVGDRLRVTVNLIKVADGTLLWSGQFEENSKDVFVVEDSISERVAEELAPELTGEQRRLLAKRDVDSPEAHEAYLKGRYFWNRRTEEGLNRAITYFQQAIDLAPNYSRAYSGLADCYALLYDYDMLPDSASIQKAKAAARKAIEIDPGLADPHCTLGYVEAIHDWNWIEADKEFRTAIALNPDYATAHHWFALELAFTGRFDESLAEIQRAQALDPLSLPINSNLGRILYFSRQYDRAIQQLQYTLQLDENFWGAHYKLAEVYEATGRYQDALAEYAKSDNIEGDKELGALLGKEHGAAGYHQAIQDWLNKLKQRSGQHHVSPYGFAVLYTALGKGNEALKWLEISAEEHSSWVVFIKADPKFDRLRSDPRFIKLLEREGLSP